VGRASITEKTGVGLAHRVGSFRLIAFTGFGDVPSIGAYMGKIPLKNIIATLEKLRDAYHSQLDASDLDELDDVLKQLIRLAQSQRQDIPLGELAMRGIRIIDHTIRLVTNITDLMK
jgi:hypothetical protein